MDKKQEFSGNLKNVGKKYFLRLAAECALDVNYQVGKPGIPYACNATIWTCMALNLSGRWKTHSFRQSYRQS